MCGELYYRRRGTSEMSQERYEALARFRDDQALLAFLIKQELIEQQQGLSRKEEKEPSRPLRIAVR